MMSDGKTRIIIIEDHLITLDGLQHQLSLEPDLCVVGTATDAEQGQSLSAQAAADIVILDLHLPKSSGPRSMVEEFSALPGKIIVLSGENRAALIKAIMKAGASAYIVKSEAIATIVQTIREVQAGGTGLIRGKQSNVVDQRLSDAEQEILKMLARGLKYQDIATLRVTSVATVKKQCEILRMKLELTSREQLIAWAINHGFGSIE